MYILIRVTALIFHVWRARARRRALRTAKRAEARALKWKYFHGFLTFTDGEYTCEMQVMRLGKEHMAQNSTSLSAAHAAFLSEPL